MKVTKEQLAKIRRAQMSLIKMAGVLGMLCYGSRDNQLGVSAAVIADRATRLSSMASQVSTQQDYKEWMDECERLIKAAKMN